VEYAVLLKMHVGILRHLCGHIDVETEILLFIGCPLPKI
jgi:hypothetical protein